MKKAFTLIELLAVIIILAIVALIATPIILDVIEDARISAGKSEANMILGGINNYCASEDMKYQLDNSYTKICTTSMNADNVKDMVNLGNAEIKEIAYDGKKLTTLVIESNNHKFTLCPSGTFAMDDEECDGEVGLVGTPIIEKVKELVYESGTCKTDGTTYQYMGGCYIKGNPTNNYIWYSGFLWRVMGINADGTVRLITDENVTAIPWGAEDAAENWDESYAKDWLNNYFYSRLKANNIIKEETWCSETTTSSSTKRITCSNNLSTGNTKVGLITLDEYNLAGGSSSYLNIGQYQWTITPYNNSSILFISDSGSVNTSGVYRAYGIRAIINVNFDITVTEGNGAIGTIWGSESGPFILSEDKTIDIIGKLNEKATSGEYVMFAGKKYRVVDKDSTGNTKLILDGYYEEPIGTIYEMEYGSNNSFYTTSGIGKKLNIDVLEWLVKSSDTTNMSKLVTNYTWYQNEFNAGDNYEVSLTEGITADRDVKATVGLIRVGEMLSGQSSSILTKGYTLSSSCSNAISYWTMTPTIWSNISWSNFDVGGSFSGSDMHGLRPVIVIKSDVTITGGNGTWSNPYQI